MLQHLRADAGAARGVDELDGVVLTCDERFFFSSRRRHTRYWRDWSSDVCSSDLRCAPPANAPTPEERDTCSPWLARELDLLPRLRVVVVLGGFGWTALWPVLAAAGYAVPRPRPVFGHGAEVELTGPRGPLTVLGSYHVSQQNTFTGTLTEPMLDAVLTRATGLAGSGS